MEKLEIFEEDEPKVTVASKDDEPIDNTTAFVGGVVSGVLLAAVSRYLRNR